MSMLPSLPQSQANTSKNTNIFLTEARVYIAGILMPTLDVSINSIFNQPPTANITLPAHPELFQIGDRDRVPVHIFVRETMVECPNFILLFEGFITGKVYTNSALQRVITLSATSVFDILNDIEVKFMSQIEDFYEMHVPGNTGFTEYVNGGGIAFPASLVMYGLIQDKDNAKVITSPSDYLDNIYAYMQLAASEESVPQEEGSSAGEQEEGAPPPLLAPHRVADRQLRPLSMLHASAMSTYYGNQARLYNFLDRFERLPYYDKPGKTPEGEEKTAWELCGFSSDGSYATAFPMLYGLQTQAAMMQVYKHMQQASPHRKLSELLAFLVEEMEYEYLFVSNPAYHAAEEEQDEDAKAAQAENKKDSEKTPEEKEAEGIQNAEKYGNAVATYTVLKYTEQGQNVPNREALMTRSREQAHQYGTKVGLSSADVEQHLNEPVASAEGRVERQKALGAKIVTATGSEKSKEAYYRGRDGVFEQIGKHKAAESQQRLSDILGSRLKKNEQAKPTSSSSGRVLRRASASAPAGAVPASGGTYRASTTTYDAARELVGLQDNTGNPEATLSGTAKKWQRNKNPGNVTGTAAQAAKVNGRDEKKHLIFATYSEGIVGWRNYFIHKYFDAQSVAKGENTLEKIVYKYAPPHENATAKYLNDLERMTGIPRNQKIDPNTNTLANIGSAMFQLETSHKFSQEEIKAVWRASDANPNAVRSVYGQHIPAGPSISGGGASSGGSSGGSAGGSSAGGTGGGSGGSGSAAAPELATPPASAPEMPASGEESPKRAKLVSSCLKPLLNDALPPKCNVMFRTMVTGVQTSFQYKGVPTRVQIRDVASALAQLLNDSNSALAQLGTIDYYPSQKYKKFEAPAGGDEKSQVTRWLSTEMLEDEKYTGPWVSVVGLPPWFNYVLNLVVKEKGDGVENPVKVFKERFFRRQLLGAKYLSRQITASGMFDPYVTPGFPGVVFDSADTGLAFAGHVLSVTHNISPQDVSTRVDMNFVRTLDEAIAEPIPHPLTPIDKINHDPAYLSNVYQTLLGTPGESVPGAEAVTFDALGGTSVGGNNPAEAYQYKRRNICTFEDYCSFMEFTVTTGNGPEGPNTPLKLSGTLLDDRRPIVVMTTVQVPQEETQQGGQQAQQQTQQSQEATPIVENVIPKQEENFPPIDDTQGKEADEARKEAEEAELKPEAEQTEAEKKAVAVQNSEKYGESIAAYTFLKSENSKDVPNREAMIARAREQAYQHGESLGISRQDTEAKALHAVEVNRAGAKETPTPVKAKDKLTELYGREASEAYSRGLKNAQSSYTAPIKDTAGKPLSEAQYRATKAKQSEAMSRLLKKNEVQPISSVEKKAAAAASAKATTPAGQTMQQPSATPQAGTQQPTQQQPPQGQQHQQQQPQEQPMVEKREAVKMDVREVLYAIAQKEFARVIFS